MRRGEGSEVLLKREAKEGKWKEEEDEKRALTSSTSINLICIRTTTSAHRSGVRFFQFVVFGTGGYESGGGSGRVGSSRRRMAKSRFEYVKTFEEDETALPNTWLVVRLDGRGFHKFSAEHGFEKPNDARALGLMNEAARQCMMAFPDIVLAYGESDEMSFVLDRRTNLFRRRKSKLLSTIVSLFSSTYVMQWPSFMRDKNTEEPAPLRCAPHFDARVVCYPTLQNLKDYLSWRQADCHINNLYNTAFWLLVIKKGLTEQEAEQRLRGTVSGEKNEILFSECGVNYNNEPAMYRKGSVIVWTEQEEKVTAQRQGKDGSHTAVTTTRRRRRPTVTFQDVIGPQFWAENKGVFPMEDLDFSRRGASQGGTKPRRKKAKQQQQKQQQQQEAQQQQQEEQRQGEQQQGAEERKSCTSADAMAASTDTGHNIRKTSSPAP